MPQNIYDDEEFFKKYEGMRENKGEASANELIEMPTLYSMLPDLKDKSVLDLGCGIGNNCKKAIELGASSVLGTDISTNMINLAKERNANKNIEYQIMAMEEIDKINKKFDVVISSLAMHYVENYEKVVKDIYNLLNNNGMFIFSQTHPMFTGTILNKECNNDDRIVLGDKQYTLVSDYNRMGKRNVTWFVEGIQVYHRNFSYLINTLINTGFKINEIREPVPSEEALKINPKYKNQYDSPCFLFIKVSK